MFKRLLVAGAVIGGVAYFVRRKMGRGYDEDEIDAADWGGDFGHRNPSAPEETMSPAETRHDVTPEELSEASRIETSMAAIQKQWPSVTADEVKSAENDRARLAELIAEKTAQPVDAVREALDGIIAEETPRPSYPAL